MADRTRDRTSSPDSDGTGEAGVRHSVTRRRPLLKQLATGIVAGTSLLAGCETETPQPTPTPTERKGGSEDSDAPGVGVYLGDESALETWEQWFGRTVDYYSFNVPTTGWEKYRVDNMPFERSIEDIAADRQIAVTAKLFPPDATTMGAVANGDHTEKHRQFAASLVAHGMGDATIRLGHELNGRWSPDTAVGRPELFAEAWRQVRSAMDEAEGASFSYMWAPHVGRVHMDPERAYPGDDWVDIVGLTLYDKSDRYFPDECGADCVRERRRENWDRLVNMEFGLDHWAEFTRTRGKTLVFPEYGVVDREWNSAGGGDNPLFFDWFAEWVGQNSDVVGWHNVWNFVAGPHYVGPPSLHVSEQWSPHTDASQAFRRNFSGG